MTKLEMERKLMQLELEMRYLRSNFIELKALVLLMESANELHPGPEMERGKRP